MPGRDSAGVVVDTSVGGVLFSGRPSAAVRTAILDARLFVSAVTIGESMRGAYAASWGARRIATLLEHIDRRYEVLALESRIGLEWAALVARCMERGHTPGANDAWIAATAVIQGMPVVTVDADFATIARHYPALRVLP